MTTTKKRPAKKKTKKKAARRPRRDLSHIAKPLHALARNVDDLANDPLNARKHDERNIEAIKASLVRFGQAKPIVLAADNSTVIAGNGTLEAARQLGWTWIAAANVGMSGGEAVAYGIADNRTAELAEWDREQLAELLTTLKDDDAGMFDATGFAQDDLDSILRSIEPAADTEEPKTFVPPKRPKAKAGTVWALGAHRVMCGDSTKAADVDALMDGEPIDLVVTSPPYLNERDYSQWESFDAYLADMQSAIECSVERRAEKFALVWNIGDVFEPDMIGRRFVACDHYAMLRAAGLEWLDWIVWNKNTANWTTMRSCHIDKGLYYPCPKWESVLVFNAGQGTQPEFDVEARAQVREYVTNVWDIGKVIGSEQKKIGHTAPFPIELPLRAIRAYSKRGATVYEPFGGSGTTLLAAERLGRRCCAMELDPGYVDVIVRRWQEETGGKAKRL
jgi:DNA modification methylase